MPGGGKCQGGNENMGKIQRGMGASLREGVTEDFCDNVTFL